MPREDDRVLSTQTNSVWEDYTQCEVSRWGYSNVPPNTMILCTLCACIHLLQFPGVTTLCTNTGVHHEPYRDHQCPQVCQSLSYA